MSIRRSPSSESVDGAAEGGAAEGGAAAGGAAGAATGWGAGAASSVSAPRRNNSYLRMLCPMTAVSSLKLIMPRD